MESTLKHTKTLNNIYYVEITIEIYREGETEGATTRIVQWTERE